MDTSRYCSPIVNRVMETKSSVAGIASMNDLRVETELDDLGLNLK